MKPNNNNNDHTQDNLVLKGLTLELSTKFVKFSQYLFREVSQNQVTVS